MWEKPPGPQGMAVKLGRGALCAKRSDFFNVSISKVCHKSHGDISEGSLNPLFHWPQPWKVFIKREGFTKRIKVSRGLWTSMIENLKSVDFCFFDDPADLAI